MFSHNFFRCVECSKRFQNIEACGSDKENKWIRKSDWKRNIFIELLSPSFYIWILCQFTLKYLNIFFVFTWRCDVITHLCKYMFRERIWLRIIVHNNFILFKWFIIIFKEIEIKLQMQLGWINRLLGERKFCVCIMHNILWLFYLYLNIDGRYTIIGFFQIIQIYQTFFIIITSVRILNVIKTCRINFFFIIMNIVFSIYKKNIKYNLLMYTIMT